MPDSLDRLSTVLTTSPRRWLDLAATVPEDVLERPAVAGEWSAVDCLRHLLQADRHVFPGRVEQFMAGAEELAVLDPAAIPPAEERTARELAEAFAQVREKNLGRLAELSPADLQRISKSRRLGPVSLGDMIHQWAMHDLQHLVQAERALLQALVVQTGQLRAAYRELDMEAEAAEALRLSSS